MVLMHIYPWYLSGITMVLVYNHGTCVNITMVLVYNHALNKGNLFMMIKNIRFHCSRSFKGIDNHSREGGFGHT